VIAPCKLTIGHTDYTIFHLIREKEKIQSLMAQHGTTNQFHGTLRHNPANPRYFTDDSGRAIYLTGSHTWATLVDIQGEGDPVFDWLGFLDMAQAHGHTGTTLCGCGPGITPSMRRGQTMSLRLSPCHTSEQDRIWPWMANQSST
jgi:hypothetical protein